jgi:hypothetical protein
MLLNVYIYIYIYIYIHPIQGLCQSRLGTADHALSLVAHATIGFSAASRLLVTDHIENLFRIVV